MTDSLSRLRWFFVGVAVASSIPSIASLKVQLDANQREAERVEQAKITKKALG